MTQAQPLAQVEYFIAGPADDDDYAQAEYLAEMLMVSLPSIKCTLMAILPDDWSTFVAEKAGYLGCKQRAPLVWMASGAVVGGLPEWASECEKKYAVVIKGVDVRTRSSVPCATHSVDAGAHMTEFVRRTLTVLQMGQGGRREPRGCKARRLEFCRAVDRCRGHRDGS